MYKLHAQTFYWVTAGLQRMRTALEVSADNRKVDKNALMAPARQKELHAQLEKLNEEICILGCRLSTGPANELMASLVDGKATYQFFSDKIREVDSRLRDELSFVEVYVVDEKRHEYLNPSALPFGMQVLEQFPAAQFEIDEAGKCYAFGRPTATVFHLMRVVEIGVGAIAACLNIPPPVKSGEQNWGAMLKGIREEIERRNKAKPVGWAAANDQRFFAENSALLDCVRIAWRNPTMHVANKYTDDEAETILHAVCGFMKNLAIRMNECGEPKA